MRATGNSVSYMVTFSCKHSRIFNSPVPVIGDQLWCPKCRAVRAVESAPAEYVIRCKTCTYTRKFGTSQINCEIAAAKHRLSKPGHVVKMFNGHDLVRTFEDRYQNVIPMMPDSNQSCPF